ncbi:hypothetical protein L596_020285 [Steinernema carpocapsae]|uniref:Fatty acid hydroxylase domain-containing protein n=1 Tax=Steinernema carpocapsae TaxID=34508 RepID=A0A4U5MT24_STECR|nr:hypothetical protein L596_020285 [Steinernema carpocapsae]
MNLSDHRVLQPFWDLIKIGHEDILSSPLFPPVYALTIDYLWALVFIVIDLYCADWPYFKKHKIQKNKVVTGTLIWQSLRLEIKNQILYILPMALVQLVWVPATVLPKEAPAVMELCGQVLLYFLIFDAVYFFFHLANHKIRFLYRWCHSVHHEFSSPFAVTAQHLHPFELFFVGGIITTLPWIMDTHPLTYWVWFFVAQSVSYEVHTGYDFPFALHHFVPFYSGAPAHDMHHLRPLTCFQPWLNYLDRLFGYHVSYEDLLKMRKEQAERYGRYEEETVQDLKKFN